MPPIRLVILSDGPAIVCVNFNFLDGATILLSGSTPKKRAVSEGMLSCTNLYLLMPAPSNFLIHSLSSNVQSLACSNWPSVVGRYMLSE